MVAGHKCWRTNDELLVETTSFGRSRPTEAKIVKARTRASLIARDQPRRRLMRKKLLSAAACGSAILLALTACGSSGETDSSDAALKGSGSGADCKISADVPIAAAFRTR